MKTMKTLSAVVLVCALTIAPAQAAVDTHDGFIKPKPSMPIAWSIPLEMRCLSAVSTNLGYRPVRTDIQTKILYAYIYRNGGTPCRSLLISRKRMTAYEGVSK
jgi:hypothetical protein